MRRNRLFVSTAWRVAGVLLFALFVAVQTAAQTAAQMPAQETSLSFEQALQWLEQGNRSLKIADKGIEVARMERGRINAFWYPSLQSSGAYVHLSEPIEVKQPLSQFTDPAKEFVQSIVPGDKIISSILDQIGGHTLLFPLAPRNLTTVDLTAQWVLFAGGKRIGASRIGNTMVELAQTSRAEVLATQQVMLAESYYGLRLAQEVVAVRGQVYNSLRMHYENALRLEAVGMIDKAGRLFAQVNCDEAKREFEAARKDEWVVQRTLKTLLNLEADQARLIPSSPLFMHDSLPPMAEFVRAVNSGNYELNRLHLQESIARQQVRMDQSGYLPTVALFGKQTLYSHGIQRNLLPRTMVGVGFTWNLFDGLEREKRIRQSRLTQQTLVLGKEKARNDLAVGVDRLYTQLEKAQDNARTLAATIALSEELVRIRKKSFAEGMATSTEVIDAETMLARVRVARLAAYYEYDIGLSNLLALSNQLFNQLFNNYETK